MRCNFHIADAVLHFHRMHHIKNLYSIILTGLKHPCLKCTNTIFYILYYIQYHTTF